MQIKCKYRYVTLTAVSPCGTKYFRAACRVNT